MAEFDGRVAAITGAARGIGAALAEELASRGCQVALSDVREEGLDETAERAAAEGVDVAVDQVDVSEREAVYDWADRVDEQFGAVHYIVNNAGVSVTATVEGLSYEDFEWLMSINFWGVVHGTKAFLPLIRRAGEGRVVNVSSIFGIMASPTQSAYNAAKFAVKGFTESLRGELELDDTEVGATCVHPGGVQTDIVRDSRIGETGPMERTPEELVAEFEEDLAQLSPEAAAEEIADGVAADRGRVLVGVDAKLMDLVHRLFPSQYPEPMARLARRGWG